MLGGRWKRGETVLINSRHIGDGDDDDDDANRNKHG